MTNRERIELDKIANDMIISYLKYLANGRKMPEKKTPNTNRETQTHKCDRCTNCKKHNDADMKLTQHQRNVKARLKRYPIADVKFYDKTTVVSWKDGTKTVSVCRESDTFNPWTGLAIAICKKFMGRQAFRDIFETYMPEEYRPEKSGPKKKKRPGKNAKPAK